jgi:hypothetical protein
MRDVAWRRRSAQAGNRGVGFGRISGVYGDLRDAAALYLTGQDALAELVRSDSSRALQFFRRHACFPKVPAPFAPPCYRFAQDCWAARGVARG